MTRVYTLELNAGINLDQEETKLDELGFACYPGPCYGRQCQHRVGSPLEWVVRYLKYHLL